MSDKEIQSKVPDEACDQLGIKRLFSNPFHPQRNAKVENVHNFLKYTLARHTQTIVLWNGMNYCHSHLLLQHIPWQQWHRISIFLDVQMRSSRKVSNLP